MWNFIKLLLQAFLLGARIWTDEKLRADGRREALLDSATRQIKRMKDYDEIDTTVSHMSDDDVFSELLKRSNRREMPRPD